MAKSIRSKHKRKMRAIKRVRYSAKELERLKKTVANLSDEQVASTMDSQYVKYSKSFNAPLGQAESNPEVITSEGMEVDKESAKSSRYNPKTLRDDHGAYPPWMNQRKIRKHKSNVSIGKQKKPTANKKNKNRKGQIARWK